MTALQLPPHVAWPPTPIYSQQLMLRAPQASDRGGLIALCTSPDARRFLGGPMTLADAEAACSGPYGRTPGSFVAETSTGAFVGTVGLDRRETHRPGHVQPGGLELEISYVVAPEQWGHGYGLKAVTAALAWAAVSLPDDRIVACTQTANAPSLALLQRAGFTDTGQQFSEFDAEQTLWQRETRPPADGLPHAVPGTQQNSATPQGCSPTITTMGDRMKTLGLGVGVAIGFLAGNAEARRKTLSAFQSIKSTPQVKAVEDKVSAKVTQLSSRVSGAPETDDSDLYSLGSEADDGATLTLSESQPSR